MLSIKVGGQWLSNLAAHGPATVEFGLHGPEAASWQMNPTFRHPLLRGNAVVQIYDGGFIIWQGRLNEPNGDGEFSARGMWHEADHVPALHTSGAPTASLDEALLGAFTRGEISWGYVNPIYTAQWATASGELSLVQLLDGVAAEFGQRWNCNPINASVSMVTDPTVPQWHVPHAVAGRGLTPAEDEFATHLVGEFFTSAGVPGSATVGSSDAATFFGRRSVKVDLTFMGFIGAVRATSVLTGMFLRAGARMGWAEGLELGYGQITTPGGTPAALSHIKAGQMVRLAGTLDTSRATLFPSNTDVVIARSVYTDGSKSITLEPLGYAPRTLGDVLDADNYVG